MRVGWTLLIVFNPAKDNTITLLLDSWHTVRESSWYVDWIYHANIDLDTNGQNVHNEESWR
jgi:hypothetical protein